MDNEGKIKQEEWEVSFLFEHLGVDALKGESPDFTFDYEGKHVGMEHTKSFPNRKTIENNSWRKIERSIEEELNKSSLPPRFISYSVATHNEGKKNSKVIAEEIIGGYGFMLENGINSIDTLENHGFKLDRLTYLAYFPDYNPKQFKLSEMVGSGEVEVDMKSVMESVNKKENKLAEYKQLPKNNAIQEYWLAVFVPPDEYCRTKIDAALFQNSQYDRIYLINGRYVGAMMQGDTSSILRLK